MYLCRGWLTAAMLASLTALPGCQFAPKGQLTACQTQNRSLAEQTKAQLAEIENLKAHNRTVENQLIQAEEELADLDQRTGVDRKQLANFEHERAELRGQVQGLARNAGRVPADFSGRLEELSRRYPWLEFDPESGMSKFDGDVLFNSGDAELKPDAQRMLSEFAALFTAPEARQLRIMVVGHTDNRQVAKRPTRERYPDNWHLSTARALAVADYLLKEGVREDQMGVAGYGRHQPISRNSNATDRERNRRVEIFVMGPETPVVGWTESVTGVY